MAALIIGTDTIIPTSDEVLDKIAKLIENLPTNGGFWLAGQYDVEVNGEPAHPDPAHGHQRLWVSTTQLMGLAYDRPLHEDPDRITELPNTVLI